MKEQFEGIQTSINNITDEFKDKFKLPIILTYSIVLILFNWDVLFYLIFENKAEVVNKITYIKTNFYTQYAGRIWKPILIASFYSILFPFIQFLINQIVQNFKKQNNKLSRQEELDAAMHKFDVQQQLSGKQSLQQLQNQIDQLVVEKDQLISANKTLIEQLKTDSSEILDSNAIINSEYDKTAKELFKEINELQNDQKSSVLELLELLDANYDSFYSGNLESKMSFPEHFDDAISLVSKFKLIDNGNNGLMRTSTFGRKFLPYFKSKYIR